MPQFSSENGSLFVDRERLAKLCGRSEGWVRILARNAVIAPVTAGNGKEKALYALEDFLRAMLTGFVICTCLTKLAMPYQKPVSRIC
jgi:hypothetical protein